MSGLNSHAAPGKSDAGTYDGISYVLLSYQRGSMAVHGYRDLVSDLLRQSIIIMGASSIVLPLEVLVMIMDRVNPLESSRSQTLGLIVRIRPQCKVIRCE